MSYPMQIDEQVLDELVSGTLSPEAYRNVLQALERQPERWRDCALAFLQEQALAQELRALARDDIDWGLPAETTDEVHPPAIPTNDRLPRPSLLASAASASTRGVAKFMSLAALLLISFSIGWFGAGLGGDAVVDMARGTADPIGSPIVDDRSFPTASVASAEQPSLHDDLPLLNQDGVRLVSDQFLPIDLEVPPELRELERRGQVRLETFDAMMPISLADGSSALLPVQQLHVVPIAYSY
jgi:hypothetical protein